MRRCSCARPIVPRDTNPSPFAGVLQGILKKRCVGAYARPLLTVHVASVRFITMQSPLDSHSSQMSHDSARSLVNAPAHV